MKPSILILYVSIFVTALFSQNNADGVGPFHDPPFHLPDDVVMQSEVYATIDGQELYLDLFLPRISPGPCPAILYVHGGLGSSTEAKQQFHRQAAYMASKGFVGACVQYRRLPEARFPAAIFDLKAAVRWLRANAEKYHLDPDKIGAAGSSGGGHMVGMLGTTIDDPAYEGKVGDNLGISSRISSAVAFNPAMDWVQMRNFPVERLQHLVIPYLGSSYQENPGIWTKASPLYHVSANSVPFLILCGDKDPIYIQSTDMVERLRAAGVQTELYTAQGAEHGFFNSPPWFDPMLKRMEEFFEKTLR